MIRLKDIAERAGVSVMTVSKSLRDALDISVATKTRIRALAQQMGYVPDSGAQGLRTRTTRLLGLVVASTSNPALPRLISGIEERAYEFGYEVILSHTLNTPEREEAVIRRLLARRVDGMIISPVYRLAPEVPIYTELRRRRVPVVLLGHPAPFCQEFCSVTTDDFLGSYAATRHLLALNHRRIAFLAGPAGVPSAQLRLDGYRKALREAGLDPEDRWVFQAGNSVEDGVTAALEILQEATRPTAIQAVNDLVAIGAATVLLSQGLNVPHDVSVVGFGNMMAAEYFRIPLTTVREHQPRWGAAAVETLLQLLRGQTVASQRFPAELLHRASTAEAAPSGKPSREAEADQP